MSQLTRALAPQGKFLRSLAEMENLRQRTKREVQDARDFAVQKFAKDLLAVADDFEVHALQSGTRLCRRSPRGRLTRGYGACSEPWRRCPRQRWRQGARPCAAWWRACTGTGGGAARGRRRCWAP